MRTGTVFAAGLAGLLAAGARGQDTGTPASRITGTVTYRERIALPPDASVRVRLDDTTEPELPGRLVAETTVTTDGRQVPVPFELEYRKADIQPSHRYAVRATIFSGGQTLFSLKSPYAVITRGAPTKVEILVQQAGAGRRPRAARSFPIPVTFTGVFPCDDC
jgi:putative lipoprotein